MPEFDFEKLDVYQKGLSFAKEVYRVTSTFPKTEQFGITSQIRKAALSVPLNIAEGVGRDSYAERKHFYYIARGSIYECVPILSMANQLSLIQDEVHDKLLGDCHQLARMLNGLIASVR